MQHKGKNQQRKDIILQFEAQMETPRGKREFTHKVSMFW